MFYDTPGAPPSTAPASPTPSPSPTASGATPTPVPTATPTAGPTTSSNLVAQGTVASFPIPSAGGVTGVAQFAGFSANSTVTLNSVAGLPTGIGAPSAAATVFYSVGVSASPAVTLSSNNCAGGCAPTFPLELQPLLNTIAAATGKTFYVAECNATACPITPADAVALPLIASALIVGPTTFADVNALGPATLWFVFFYQ